MSAHNWTVATSESDWSRRVRERSGGKCVWCGADGDHPHHIIFRVIHAMSLIVENGIYLCAEHHIIIHSLMKRSGLYEKMCRILIGDDLYLALELYRSNLELNRIPDRIDNLKRDGIW